jgi:cyclic pyranopterin phosphate synthase
MNELSHFDESGRVKMVDVADKPVTQRTAVASCKVMLAPETIAAVSEKATPKGDPLEIARIAGIMAAKKTSELIPLCHQINLSKADVTAELTVVPLLVDRVAPSTVNHHAVLDVGDHLFARR